MSYGNNHPSTRILGSISHILKGKNILLGITGSVAAYLSPKFARELIRYGANVIPVMSQDGIKMVGKDLMWWATGNKPITEVTGDLEHIRVAGIMNQPIDLMIILPCTTNTVGKLAAGIGDTSVTLIANTLSGKQIPIMLMPVAHEDLINSPSIQTSLTKLKSWGYSIIEPLREEGKAKVPDTMDIVEQVINLLSEKTLKDKRIIITAGPTREYIDNVRFITNEASGRTGILIAKKTYYKGARVTLVLGPTSLDVPEFIDTIKVNSSEEMTQNVLHLIKNEDNPNIILSSAMADFTPQKLKKGKIKSGSELKLTLKNTTKLSDEIKKISPNSNLILFKAEWDVTKEDLISSAKRKMDKTNADLIIANDLSLEGAGFATITNHAFIITKDNILEFKEHKSKLANKIIEYII